MYLYIYVFNQHLRHRQDVTQDLEPITDVGLNSVFFLLYKLPSQTSLPYYLPIGGGREMDSYLSQGHKC